jgi:sensor histidine kinase regulating citrate/malate metabolism
VLENLVKNALEASKSGQTVMLVYTNQSNPIFAVQSQTYIPTELQSRIFHRAVTTKQGKGHGIGLHSVRLLTEQYLGCKVTFTSTETGGTTFTVELPPAMLLTADLYAHETGPRSLTRA